MARLGRDQPKRAFITRAPVEVEPAIEITPAAVTVTVSTGTLAITTGPVNIIPAAVTITVTAGALTVSQHVTPAVVTVTVTPGSLAVGLNIVPAAVAVSATPGSLTVVVDQAVSPAPVNVAVTPGTVAIAIDQTISPAPVTVNATPGAVTVAQILGPVRIFDGTDDFIEFDVGALGGWDGTEAFSVAVLWKPDSVHDGWLFWSNTPVLRLNAFSDGNLWFLAGGDSEQTSAYIVDEWQLVVFTKPGGTGAVQVRSHIYDYSTTSWSHQDEGTASSGAQTLATLIRVGIATAGADKLDGKLAAIAVWAGSSPWALGSGGDATIEAAGLITALQDWADADPDLLWRFNQSTVAEDVLDLTGGGADQTAITGTTVDTTDAPDGFDFTLLEGITPSPVTVNVTPGSLSIDQHITLAGPTVAVTPGTLGVTTEGALLPVGPTVAVTPGTVTVTIIEVPTRKQFVLNQAAHRETIRRHRQPATGWLDFGPPLLAVTGAIVPNAVIVTASPGTLTIRRTELISPAPVTVSATPGTLAVTAAQAIAPAPVTVAATAGALTVTAAQAVTLTGPTVAATPGSLTVVAGLAVAPSSTAVNVTPGTVTITTGPVNISPAAVTVAVTAGTLASITVGDQAIELQTVLVTVSAGQLRVRAPHDPWAPEASTGYDPWTPTVGAGDPPFAPASGGGYDPWIPES